MKIYGYARGTTETENHKQRLELLYHREDQHAGEIEILEDVCRGRQPVRERPG
jgi:hypothetical protein